MGPRTTAVNGSARCAVLDAFDPGVHGVWDSSAAWVWPRAGAFAGEVVAAAAVDAGLWADQHAVMTDEQLETLRRQISVYSTICQQLVEMHKASVPQQAALPAVC
ncbi:hypothetical protein KC19_3G040400 [Ceratodon purpureus]|uniref:Uncharacterized protein n=1 Tax=Ceratodon purpureus TaxID=3225 RepID=A0A8T0IFN9_CERPU|nr:hypothetical protein KC19_3G040400 [Ceratodon purpureus]